MFYSNSQPIQVYTFCSPSYVLLSDRLDKRTRGAAINTLKPWVPHHQPMDGYIREFALQMLRKLQLCPTKLHGNNDAEGTTKTNGHSDDNGSLTEVAVQDEKVVTETMSPTEQREGSKERGHEIEDGQLPQEDLVHTPYLPERIELPAQKQQVLQHVELLFALSVKVPEFLDE